MTRRQAVAFAVFCLLGGSRWIADSAWPSALPEFEQATLHYCLIGLAAAVVLLSRKHRPLPQKKWWLQVGGSGLLLLGLPSLIVGASHGITPATQVGLFALVPLFVVVGRASLGTSGRSLMMPALAGLSGVLLLLPFQLPGTLTGGLSFGLVVAATVLTAIASVWMHSLLQSDEVLPAILAISFANAVLLGVAMLMQRPIDMASTDLLTEAARCLLLDLPLLFLLIWLMKAVPPSRIAVRFLLLPLVSTVEGSIALHAPVDWRLALGAALTASGSIALLLWKETDDLEGGRLRLT